MIFCAKLQKSIVSAKEKGELFSFIKEKQYLCTLINQKYDMPQSLHIAIIGGGAAGFFAAIEAKRNFPHADITIFEKNSKVLAKVEITGGGRCNLTNSFDEISDLKQAYPRGHKLMNDSSRDSTTSMPSTGLRRTACLWLHRKTSVCFRNRRIRTASSTVW